TEVDEGSGVVGEVDIVVPEIAPDAGGDRELFVDDLRREAFEGDPVVIADGDQRIEDGGEVDVAGTQIAAMAFPDMDIADLVGGVADGKADVRLLDVHVKTVEVEKHIVRAGGLDEGEALGGGVEQIALEAIDDFEVEGDACASRNFSGAGNGADTALPA